MTAAGFGWRAAQIGSTAAYDDRQSIGDTVKVEQAAVERAVTVAADALEYARYRADYAAAAALDREAKALAAQGASRQAAGARAEAAALRVGATRRAAAAGVFGSFDIATDLLRPTATPRPFDYQARASALAAEQSASFDSPAGLAPDRWASKAEAIRGRIDTLTRGTLLIVLAIFLYTAAEVSRWRRLSYVFIGGGLALYLAGFVGNLSDGFF